MTEWGDGSVHRWSENLAIARVSFAPHNGGHVVRLSTSLPLSRTGRAREVVGCCPMSGSEISVEYVASSKRNASFVFRSVIVWLLASAGFHTLWELAQLPLYTLWQDPSVIRIVAYVAHCIGGDVLIMSVAYLGTAVLLRELRWPWRRPILGTALLVLLGTGYTFYSEWVNVYREANWAYTSSMPTVFGIGLTPIMQWLLIPPWVVGSLRRYSPAPHRSQD